MDLPTPLDPRGRVTASSAPGAVAPGVLALQGSVAPHCAHFRSLGHDVAEVRLPRQLEGVTHLVIPGGESTTLAKLLRFYELWDPIATRAREGSLAIFGTCAGAILLGRTSPTPPPRFGLLDIEIDRNAYGRQIDSFVAPVDSDEFDDLEGVFIRAPRIRACGPDVEVLARLRSADGSTEPVLVACGRLMAATFHPELTRSDSVHSRFLQR
ncbi:MAG: pyridoxal 5'-phosphate synthase glutaminase subunit PdxT [Planctomycetes bacterium]|nr:pyridoxal 5'-phosphate synthase glutaminase subunit PdxT [Planctomycetota bacterium]